MRILEQVEGIPCLFVRRKRGKIHSLYDQNNNRLPLGGLIESPAATKSSEGAFNYKGELITQEQLVRDLKEYLQEVSDAQKR